MKQIVLVTGASGFLGQHVVKLLQEKDSRVREIRCFDLKPYENKLGKLPLPGPVEPHGSRLTTRASLNCLLFVLVYLFALIASTFNLLFPSFDWNSL